MKTFKGDNPRRCVQVMFGQLKENATCFQEKSMDPWSSGSFVVKPPWIKL